MPQIIPVILAGGTGERLWPVSTAARPKQFHALGEDRSLFQETVLRAAAGAGWRAPVIICGCGHEGLVRQQLAEIAVAPAGLVLEPFGRNTAAAAMVAARCVSEIDPDALVLLLPADHRIGDAAGFRAVVASAAGCAGDHIVTFGIVPDSPHAGYGYIERGGELAEGVFRVERFTEKPDEATAREFLRGGGYLWNAGIFLFSPAVLHAETISLCPDIAVAANQAWDEAERDGERIPLAREPFEQCPAISIDTAIMEHTSRAAVAPCDIDWSDVGAWEEVWRLRDKDTAENAIHGDAFAMEASGNLLWSDGPTIAVLGIKDLIVVATEDGVLVAPRDRAEDVKRLSTQLRQTPARPCGPPNGVAKDMPQSIVTNQSIL